jgi:hypothetical protein
MSLWSESSERGCSKRERGCSLRTEGDPGLAAKAVWTPLAARREPCGSENAPGSRSTKSQFQTGDSEADDTLGGQHFGPRASHWR